MPLPTVVIVGRPNVGKSSLLNCLAGRRISIVDPTAGVTRDRVGTVVHVGDRYFELIDTGGIGIVDQDNLAGEVERQIQIAIEQADVILFVVDIRNGVMPLGSRTPPAPSISLSLVANKCDAVELTAGRRFFRGTAAGALLQRGKKHKRN